MDAPGSADSPDGGDGRWDVFISAAATDSAAAEMLRLRLTARAVRVFSDGALSSGQRWRTVISEALAGARVLVVLVPSDPSAMASLLPPEVESLADVRPRARVVLVRLHDPDGLPDALTSRVPLGATFADEPEAVVRHITTIVGQARRADPEPTDLVLFDGPLDQLAMAVPPVDLLGAGRVWGLGRGGLLALLPVLARCDGATFDISTWHDRTLRRPERRSERRFTRMLVDVLGERTFDDVAGGHWDDDGLAVVVSDMTAGRPVALPGALAGWGRAPGSLVVADLVRATMGRLVRRMPVPAVRDQQGNPHVLQASTRPLLPHRPGPDRPLSVIDLAPPPRAIADRVQQLALPDVSGDRQGVMPS